ncbi:MULTISPECIES: DUF4129 domain-containing protein [Halorussus]|uniref:DUF4129 domain-containing protein n=1 Tax=Halorussus TaxID=1070314 RepID=UPI00209DAF53|nr:DUF4129 domain-containing protein [Halorussus vallis]USZ77918.1 DUF4129 domain-containing protein [Halorussus vallis]
MGHNRRHAALAALCVLAVLLAASLLPASGFGTYPAGFWSDRGAGAPGGTAGSGAGFDGPDRPVPTSTRTTQETTDGTTTETTTARETETTTATTAASDGDDGGGDASGAAFAVLGLFAAVVIAGLGFGTGMLSVAAAAGALPFTITVRGTPIGKLVGGLPERTMTLVVGFSSAAPQLLDDAGTLLREVGGGLSMVVGGLGTALGRTARFGFGGLGAAFVAVPRALSGLGSGPGLLSGVTNNLSVPSFGGKSNSRRSSGGGGSSADADPTEPAPPSVEEAWETLADRVPGRRRRSRTPGEIARAAVERGYPDDAVRQLTRAFEEVRYGGKPRDDRTSVARSALDRLRRYWEGDE